MSVTIINLHENKNYNIDVSRFVIKENEERIGTFRIEKKGNIQLDILNYFEENPKTIFKNSAFLQGGFFIESKFRKKGYGRKIVKLIFENDKSLENIFFYAIEWQRAIPFWLKIGGISLLKNSNGLHFMKLERKKVLNNII